jgi:hypothetical protein
MLRWSRLLTTGWQAVAWVFAGIATVALGARLYTRYYRFTRYYWDDFFCILGWAFSIPLAVATTMSAPQHVLLDTGGSTIFLSRPMTQFLFYSSLWSIKISFLIFFRRIGVDTLRKLKRYWTCVFCFTVLAYGLTWTLNPYSCWAEKGVMMCERDAGTQRIRPFAFGIATFFDVLTDCLSELPFAIIWSKLMRRSYRNTVCRAFQCATPYASKTNLVHVIRTGNHHHARSCHTLCGRGKGHELKDHGCDFAAHAHAHRSEYR